MSTRWILGLRHKLHSANPLATQAMGGVCLLADTLISDGTQSGVDALVTRMRRGGDGINATSALTTRAQWYAPAFIGTEGLKGGIGDDPRMILTRNNGAKAPLPTLNSLTRKQSHTYFVTKRMIAGGYCT